uniref:Uncharacterized protein n=1 Tax=Arundo donax TaxID=35708 RepID=A0A0A9A5K0_ARUDO
MRSTTSARELL